MINEIVNSIANNLSLAYKSAKIYIEKVPQKFTSPCFIIKALDTESNKQLDNTYKNSTGFAIQYISTSNEDAVLACELLRDILEYIMVNDFYIRGENMKLHVENEVGTFTINYKYYSRRNNKPAEKMVDYERDLQTN